MAEFLAHKGFSMVTAILPRQTSGKVMEEVFNAGATNGFSTNARGSLIQDRWYQSFLPALSPEQEVLHFLAPASETGRLMEQIVMLGQLQLYGTGAIYSSACETLQASEDYPIWARGKYVFESTDFDVLFRRNLTGLVCVAQIEQTDAIVRAAIKAGAHGPTITYAEGFGLRDRLGLLRITKKPVKEVVQVVVDACDAEPVFEAMARAGRVDQPGRGLLFQFPIQRGLVNLASVFSSEKHSVSIQEIVNAIDNMKGDSGWRRRQLVIHNEPKVLRKRKGARTKGSVLLLGICARKDVVVLMDAALEHGAPGASISYSRFVESEAQVADGKRINREVALISMILSADQVEGMREVMKQEAVRHEMRQTCFMTQGVPVLETYVG